MGVPTMSMSMKAILASLAAVCVLSGQPAEARVSVAAGKAVVKVVKTSAKVVPAAWKGVKWVLRKV